MKFLTQPNAHTREFLTVCHEGNINTLEKFFERKSWLTKKILHLFKKTDYSSYQLEHDYCCWFGLEIAARNNDFKLVDYLLSKDVFQYYISKDWTKAIFFTYNLFEPKPIIKLIQDNEVKDKNYFIHIAKNGNKTGPIFQYKEIKPIYIDDPILTAIENFNIPMFNYLSTKLNTKGIINLDYYAIKFLRFLDKSNINDLDNLPKIKEIIQKNIEFSVLEIIYSKNEYAMNFLINNFNIPDNIISDIQQYTLSEPQLEFYQKLNHQLKFNKLTNIINKQEKEKNIPKKQPINKKIIKV